jgi:hypothetical protein
MPAVRRESETGMVPTVSRGSYKPAEGLKDTRILRGVGTEDRLSRLPADESIKEGRAALPERQHKHAYQDANVLPRDLTRTG